MTPWEERVVRCPVFEGRAFVLLLEISFLQEEAFAQALACVPPWRREKALAQQLPGGARLCLGAGLICQMGLESLTGRGDWQVSRSPSGKPGLPEEERLTWQSPRPVRL